MAKKEVKKCKQLWTLYISYISSNGSESDPPSNIRANHIIGKRDTIFLLYIFFYFSHISCFLILFAKSFYQLFMKSIHFPMEGGNMTSFYLVRQENIKYIKTKCLWNEITSYLLIPKAWFNYFSQTSDCNYMKTIL